MTPLFEILQPHIPDLRETGNEVQIRCPYCQDRKQRLYISSAEPHPWICFHCSRSGKMMTEGLLNALGIGTSPTLSRYVGSLSTSAARGGRVSHLPRSPFRPSWADTDSVPLLDRQAARLNLRWLQQRFQRQVSREERTRFKMILHIPSFFNHYGIDAPQHLHRFNIERSIGFMSAGDAKMVLRSTLPNPSIRFTTLTFQGARGFIKGYSVRKHLDTLSPRFKIVITEGIFDLMQVEHLFHADELDDPSFLSVAMLGNAFPSLLEGIARSGLFPADIHYYADDEPGPLEAAAKPPPPIFSGEAGSTLTVYRNATPGEKDFGIPESRIDLFNIFRR